MLHYAVVFFIIAIVAAILGFAVLSYSVAARPAGTTTASTSVSEGTLARYVATLRNGRTEHRYALKQSDGHSVWLQFDTPPISASGAKLACGIWPSRGSHVDDQFAGSRNAACVAFEQNRRRTVLLDERRTVDARAGAECGALINRA